MLLFSKSKMVPCKSDQSGARVCSLFLFKHLSDQEISIALEEFEETMVDVIDLLLSLLENSVDCSIFTSSAKRLFDIP